MASGGWMGPATLYSCCRSFTAAGPAMLAVRRQRYNPCTGAVADRATRTSTCRQLSVHNFPDARRVPLVCSCCTSKRAATWLVQSDAADDPPLQHPPSCWVMLRRHSAQRRKPPTHQLPSAQGTSSTCRINSSSASGRWSQTAPEHTMVCTPAAAPSSVLRPAGGDRPASMATHQSCPQAAAPERVQKQASGVSMMSPSQRFSDAAVIYARMLQVRD